MVSLLEMIFTTTARAIQTPDNKVVSSTEKLYKQICLHFHIFDLSEQITD